MVKCPKKYKNLGSDYFGEQRYVLKEMLEQFCKNDAYLKDWVENLFYMSPPATRKRFAPIPVDASKSYGYDDKSQDNIIRFDNSTSKIQVFDFFDESVIDQVKSNTILKSYNDGESVVKRVTLPLNTKSTLHTDTRDYSPWTRKSPEGGVIADDTTCNEYWYIGFDRARHYETRPNWLLNQLNGEIPGITRAQTFKAKNNGRLTGITLNLHGGTNTGMPLVVEIRTTTKKDGIYYPVDSDHPHLAFQLVNFNTTDPGVYTIAFEHPPTLKKDETYAVVLLSPLSHPSNCYWVGGWSSSCQAEGYSEGDAFLSENCGYTWIRYGKKEEVDYHMGQQAPEDFFFQCHIEEQTEEYATNEWYDFYLKPIYSNPVTNVSISAYDEGDTVGGTGSIEYWVSNNGKNWFKINKTGSCEFTNPKHTTFIKARLKTTDKNSAPFIEELKVSLTTLPVLLDSDGNGVETSSYIRTIPYAPRTDGILGANVWSRINAPYWLSNGNVKCSVEIILNKEVQEHFTIIEPREAYEYRKLDFNNKFNTWDKLKPSSTATSIEKRNSEDNDRAWDWLDSQPSMLKFLAENNIYITGYTQITGDGHNNSIPGFIWNKDQTDKVNEDNNRLKIHLKGNPAYPLIYCSLQPKAKGETTINYGEWYDYEVDYDNQDIEPYYTQNYSNYPKPGTLTVRYNPLFIKNLNGQLKKETSPTGGETYITDSNSVMPFKLDYIKQDIKNISQQHIEQGFINLQCAPVDPIKEVILNPESDDTITDETYLEEDKDYTIDYDNNRLILTKDNNGYVKNISIGDSLRIIYTPDLEDNSLCLGYKFSRNNSDDNIEIHPNYIEYKT